MLISFNFVLLAEACWRTVSPQFIGTTRINRAELGTVIIIIICHRRRRGLLFRPQPPWYEYKSSASRGAERGKSVWIITNKVPTSVLIQSASVNLQVLLSFTWVKLLWTGWSYNIDLKGTLQFNYSPLSVAIFQALNMIFYWKIGDDMSTKSLS